MSPSEDVMVGSHLNDPGDLSGFPIFPKGTKSCYPNYLLEIFGINTNSKKISATSHLKKPFSQVVKTLIQESVCTLVVTSLTLNFLTCLTESSRPITVTKSQINILLKILLSHSMHQISHQKKLR